VPDLLYIQLVGFTAGAILHLFLLVLVLAYRRPRGFERLLFLLVLALFVFYSGGLLKLNLDLHYPVPPQPANQFAITLMVGGLAALPPLLVHVHAEYFRIASGHRGPAWFRPLAALAYLPLAYFLFVAWDLVRTTSSLAFLEPGARWTVAYGWWLTAALGVAALLQGWLRRLAAGASEKAFHRAACPMFAAMALLTFLTYVVRLGEPPWSPALGTVALLAAIVPSAVFGYFVLRYNFLQIGVPRNLVYAVSAVFLALLYLAVIRRVSGWLEPVLPPEATIAILLFVLVLFFEPLQRRISRGLHRMLRVEVDRLQRLTAEVHQEARHGDLARLLDFAEHRIREEFALLAVRIVLHQGPPRPPVPSGRVQRLVVRDRGREVGVLEAWHDSAMLSGDTHAALEFLAEQLPAAIDLCRLIDAKLRLERELAERERLALVGQMAASISHNLKNPLSSIKTLLQVQLEDPHLPEALRRDCALVVVEMDRLSTKLGQLLCYARPALHTEDRFRRVAAGAQAEEIMGLLRHEAARRNVSLRLDRPAEELYVQGTADGFHDVLSNLVLNAMEAAPAGGSVELTLRRQAANLVIEVTDDGPGIAEDIRPRLFQPFFTTKATGTGLGLAIVERRLAEMQGAIAWQSPVRGGRGARFVVTLPLSGSPEAAVALARRAASQGE